MAFCTNCGTDNKNNSKFCPNCGTEITVDSDKIRRRPPPKRKMQKGVVKSLQDNVKNTIEEKTQDYIKGKAQDFVKEKAQGFIDKSTSDVPPKSSVINQKTADNETGDVVKKVRKWMLWYILVNIPLYFINTGDDEILGVLIFSVAVIVGFIIFSLQKKKEKPYTIVLKIILLLQGLLAVSGIMMRLEFMDSGNSLVAIISLALLVFLNIKIILRRNK